MASIYETQEHGLHGSVNETGTTAITGDFYMIDCITACTFSLLTDALASGDALTGTALPAGTKLWGRFSEFTLTSGIARAYKAAPRA